LSITRTITRTMFVQLFNFYGFALVDWEKRREVQRITLPDIPVAK